jgi:hypothetical protein
MRTVTIMLCVLFATPTPASAGGKKKKAELRWARGVAREFLDIAVDKDRDRSIMPTSVAGLISPHAAEGILGQRDINPLWKLSKFTEAKITREQVSPDRREVIFFGTLAGSRWESEKDKTATFKMRLAKEPGGRWSIRSLLVTEREAEKKGGQQGPPGRTGP